MKPQVKRMRMGSAKLMWAALVAALMLPCLSGSGSELRAAGPQGESQESEAAPRVSLSEITGTPGSSLMVPLYYTASDDMPLRSLTIEIDFVSNSLKFEKASPGVVIEQVGADLSAELVDGEPDDREIVRSKLTISTSLMEENPQEGVPGGLLAFLLFRVSTEAKAFAIRMNTSVSSAVPLNPSQQVAQVNAVSGTVVIELADMIPEASCFFFSH